MRVRTLRRASDGRLTASGGGAGWVAAGRVDAAAATSALAAEGGSPGRRLRVVRAARAAVRRRAAGNRHGGVSRAGAGVDRPLVVTATTGRRACTETGIAQRPLGEAGQPTGRAPFRVPGLVDRALHGPRGRHRVVARDAGAPQQPEGSGRETQLGGERPPQMDPGLHGLAIERRLTAVRPGGLEAQDP